MANMVREKRTGSDSDCAIVAVDNLSTVNRPTRVKSMVYSYNT